MKFSVLMSIYYKEKPEYFDRCMKSIWDDQSVKPNEIVLVEDGALTNELYEIIERWQNKLGNIFKIIPLEKNLGTGEAKNIGLKECSYEFIAVMDTDDIANSKRFEKQLEIFREKDIEVCSSWISEFEDEEDNIISFRKLPEYHNDILNFAKKRMPVNHPATMYKKDIALKAGGYKHMLWFEDYYLMVRMMINGAKFYNIQEPLVNMRVGYGQLERRRGFKYVLEEAKFLKELKNIGFITQGEYVMNLVLRSAVRITPKFIIKRVYKILRNS